MRRWIPWLTVVVLVITYVIASGGDDSDRPPPKPKPPPVVMVDGPDADTKADDPLPLPAPAQEVKKKVENETAYRDVAEPMRGPDPTPPGLEPGAPLASQEWPGCRTAFVRNFSARTSAVKAIALHYTAGPNITGWADLVGLTAYSNVLANGVSWHFGIDREGHCTYNVPINHKAWTISQLNSQTVNIEGVGTGREPDYLDTAGFAKMSAVVRRVARIYDIPLRLGATDGHCHVTRKGLITHWMGGPCSGGHDDVHPYDIQRIVAQIARDAGPRGGTARQRASCRKLNWWRRTREKGKARRNAVLRRETLARRGLTCTRTGLARA